MKVENSPFFGGKIQRISGGQVGEKTPLVAA